VNTGSRDEQMLLANVARIAKALERLANCAEETVYGVTGAEVATARELLKRDTSTKGS
jgi:hypothetical protein